MYTIGEIAKFIDAEIVGDSTIKINSIASVTTAKGAQLTYISEKKHKQALTSSQASVVILNKELLNDCPTNALVVNDVHLAFAKITHYFKKQTTHQAGIHPSAKINNAKIAKNCVIGKNVIIGSGCIISANTVIEDNVVIGSNAYLHPNITILQGCLVGDNVVISSGVVIGSEGFGNARDDQGCWHSIAHLGNVVIGNNVTIGANTTIDRGTLDNTKIHDGVRLDNLIQVAHNVTIGEHTAIAASSAIAGSATIGRRCMVGGMVGIIGHISICDDVVIGGKSIVDKNIKAPGMYTGVMPLMPHKQWKNVGLWLTKLDKIIKYLNIKLKNLKD
ncbi:MAG: UDP-3-O-(3-hydroxymyristoyl)glucosamine N-acyltransferase [Gammaproteobacteria bacterium]|nr:UDP-3-O-(3-hydroxymyristoyl)glucosamine N-acyltransferase [Gammaproteobacteria bacterium]